MGGGRTWRFDFTDNKLERSPTFSVSIPLLLPRGTPLYKPPRYVLLQRVEVLRCFGLKTGIDFVHLGLKSDSFRRIQGVYERMYRFNIK